MRQCKLDDENFEQLIFAIRRKRCILMLGPDASVEQVNGKPQTLNEILANKLAQKIRPDFKEHINLCDLTEVAQYYQMEHGRNALEIFVESFYRKRQNSVSEIHQNLAALPFEFAMTASPLNVNKYTLKQMLYIEYPVTASFDNFDLIIQSFNEPAGPALNKI